MTPREHEEYMLIRDADISVGTSHGRTVRGAFRKAVLFVLWSSQGVPISRRAIASRVCCDVHHVFTTLSSLVIDGIIIKSPGNRKTKCHRYHISFQRLKELQQPEPNVQSRGTPCRNRVATLKPGAVSIVRLRLKMGITQQELASLVGVSKAVVSRWECGHINPSPDNRRRLDALERREAA